LGARLPPRHFPEAGALLPPGGEAGPASSGSTANLWAEVIENIQPGPLEAAAVTGASRLKVLSFALVPDVAPSMVSIGLFWWEFNVRASTVLGVVERAGSVRSSRTPWTFWTSR
jgi:phosphonate transport system permease protein